MTDDLPDPSEYEGLTRWVLERARSGKAAPALAVAGFLDSSIVPMPLEVPLAGLMIGARHKIPLFLAAVIAGALVGAMAMYAGGALAMDAISGMLGDSLRANIEEAAGNVREGGFVAIALGGLTPFPWPIVSLGAGAAELNPLVFLAGALAGRGGRFALIAGAVALFGHHALNWWADAPNWAKTAFWVVISLGGLVWVWLAFRGGG